MVLLQLTVHHVAFDGASTGVLLGELGRCVRCVSCTRRRRACMSVVGARGRAGATRCRCSAPACEYVDYALWQRSEALAPHLASHRAYWRSALREGDLPVLELPLDYPRPAVQTFNGDVVSVDRRVGGVASRGGGRGRVGCTLFQCVLGVWCVVLCRHAGQEEVVVGSPYHGRDVVGRRV